MQRVTFAEAAKSHGNELLMRSLLGNIFRIYLRKKIGQLYEMWSMLTFLEFHTLVSVDLSRVSWLITFVTAKTQTQLMLSASYLSEEEVAVVPTSERDDVTSFSV